VEVLHLHISECTVFVQLKLLDHCVQDLADICMGFLTLETSEVFLIGLNPAYIVMGVRNNMDR